MSKFAHSSLEHAGYATGIRTEFNQVDEGHRDSRLVNHLLLYLNVHRQKGKSLYYVSQFPAVIANCTPDIQVILRLKAAANAKGESGLTLTRGSCVNQAMAV